MNLCPFEVGEGFAIDFRGTRISPRHTHSFLLRHSVRELIMIVVFVMWAATNSFAEQPSSPSSFCSLGTSAPVLQRIPLTSLEPREPFKDAETSAVATGSRSSSCLSLLSSVTGRTADEAALGSKTGK